MSYLGGIATGLILGGIFYQFGRETRCIKAAKILLIVTAVGLSVGLIAAAFSLQDSDVSNMNSYIDSKCL